MTENDLRPPAVVATAARPRKKDRLAGSIISENTEGQAKLQAPRNEAAIHRRACETFVINVAGLRYTATVSWFADGRPAELFLSHHKSNSASDTNAGDSAIVLSFALQHGADAEAIRNALCRDSQGRASGPLGVALDTILRAKQPIPD